MKKIFIYLFVVLVTSTVLVMCKKEKLERITAQELKDKYSIVLPDLYYEGDEIPTSKPGEKGGGKKSASLLIVTVFHDLNAEISGSFLVGDVSPDAYVAGGQKFIDTTINDGAVGLWACGKRYASPPGSGATTSCPTEGTGYYRVFSADFETYNIHLSWFKRVD